MFVNLHDEFMLDPEFVETLIPVTPIRAEENVSESEIKMNR